VRPVEDGERMRSRVLWLGSLVDVQLTVRTGKKGAGGSRLAIQGKSGTIEILTSAEHAAWLHGNARTMFPAGFRSGFPGRYHEGL